MSTKRKFSFVAALVLLSLIVLLGIGAGMVGQEASRYGAAGAAATAPATMPATAQATVTTTALPDDPRTSPLATPDPLEPTPVPVDPVEYALGYTRALFPNITGEPHAIYSSPITLAEFSEYGIDPWQPNGAEPPMVFVLVAGDFDVSDYGVGQPISFARAKYIGYVIDMRAATLNTTAISEDGSLFANLLQSLGLWEATPVATVTPNFPVTPTETAMP